MEKTSYMYFLDLRQYLENGTRYVQS